MNGVGWEGIGVTCGLFMAGVRPSLFLLLHLPLGLFHLALFALLPISSSPSPSLLPILGCFSSFRSPFLLLFILILVSSSVSLSSLFSFLIFIFVVFVNVTESVLVLI